MQSMLDEGYPHSIQPTARPAALAIWGSALGAQPPLTASSIQDLHLVDQTSIMPRPVLHGTSRENYFTKCAELARMKFHKSKIEEA